MFLSVIIPAHNEADRLPATIRTIANYLGHKKYSSEIIVVENGSTDGTEAVAWEALHYAKQWSRVTCGVLCSKQGKGAAVKAGMLWAEGTYRYMCDVDLSTPITVLPKLFAPMRDGADVVIASREAAGARRIDEPARRHITGRVFSALTHPLLPGINDTQCGFKLFTETAARQLFHQQTIDGWAFDVEILYMARRLGYRIDEVGVDWHYNADSRVHVARDSVRMARDIFRIWTRGQRGYYRGTPFMVSV